MRSNTKPKKQGRWLIYIAVAIVLSAGLGFAFAIFPTQDQEIRCKLPNSLEKTFPQEAAEIAKSFGLTYHGEASKESLKLNPAASSVVLIHGLDDPGKVWMNLAPTLVSRNINVWQMHYPNDQPRPHPDGVKLLIIAGVASPWDGRDIDRFLDSARKNSPAAIQKMLVDLESFFKSMSEGLGDGLVTVKSTRLEGIEHRTVRGNHLSMIHNLSIDSSRTPPTVPVIIEYLEQVFSNKQDYCAVQSR